MNLITTTTNNERITLPIKYLGKRQIDQMESAQRLSDERYKKYKKIKKSEATSNAFNLLPEEIMIHIFNQSQIQLEDLCNLRLASKQFYRLTWDLFEKQRVKWVNMLTLQFHIYPVDFSKKQFREKRDEINKEFIQSLNDGTTW